MDGPVVLDDVSVRGFLIIGPACVKFQTAHRYRDWEEEHTGGVALG